MQLTIESPGIRISDNLQELIRQKINHLGKMYDRITNCEVILKKEKNDHNKNCYVESQLSVSGKTLFADNRDENFEIALQKVVDGLAHQLLRYKQERNETW